MGGLERHFQETPRDSILHERFDAARQDPHLEGVIWDDLDAKDLILLEKLLQGRLAEADITQRREALESELRLQGDPSVEFAAMLLNKLMVEKAEVVAKKVRARQKSGGSDIGRGEARA